MKIITPSFEVLTPVNGDEMLKALERFGRVCYKSEGRISEGTAGQFIGNLVNRGHESVIEHLSVTVKVICDRGVTHEIVRHRIASYSQESTRYCNYSAGIFGSEITVIRPYFWKDSEEKYEAWKEAMSAAECAYMRLMALGASPQEARSVLPNSLKTEIVITMNLREWKHFFRLRTEAHAHPQMREVAVPILRDFQSRIPIIFDDIPLPEFP